MKPSAFWCLSETWDTRSEKIDNQLEKDRLSISIANIEDAHKILDSFSSGPFDHAARKAITPDRIIPIELEITAPGYAPDYFFESGFAFVSARFREVADFPSDAVQYLDAPCIRCTPEATAKDYQALWVHHTEDVLDPDKTIIRSPAELTIDELLYTRNSFVYRKGYHASSPVFYLRHRAETMVTHDMARKLAAARLDGVALEDLTRLTSDLLHPRMGPDGELITW